MHNWIWITPLLPAAVGWAVALGLRAFLLSRLPSTISRQVLAAEGEFPLALLRSKISDPGNIQNIMPLIESHVDEFLRHKIGKAIPMLTMFIGDKTIAQLKAVFLAELEELFPVVIGQYTDSLDLHTLIRETLLSIPEKKMKKMLIIRMRGVWSAIPLAGLLIGLVAGVVQLIFIFILPFIY